MCGLSVICYLCVHLHVCVRPYAHVRYLQWCIWRYVWVYTLSVQDTYIQIEEAQNAFVRQDVEGVATVPVYHRQPMHAELHQHFDGFKQTLIWLYVDQWPRVVLEDF